MKTTDNPTLQSEKLEPCDYRKPGCAAYGQTVGTRWVCNNHICERLKQCWLNSRAPVVAGDLWLPIGDAPKSDTHWLVVAKIADSEPNKGAVLWWYRAMFWRGAWRTSRDYFGSVEPTHFFDPEQMAASSPASSPVSEVETWKRDLIAAGWTEESATAWYAPDGGLYRGPYGAWKELQRRSAPEQKSACDHDISYVRNGKCQFQVREVGPGTFAICGQDAATPTPVPEGNDD